MDQKSSRKHSQALTRMLEEICYSGKWELQRRSWRLSFFPQQGRRRQLGGRDALCSAQLRVAPAEPISGASTHSLSKPCPSSGRVKELRHLHHDLAKEPSGNTQWIVFANYFWKQTQSTLKLPAVTRCCTWDIRRCFAKRA